MRMQPLGQQIATIRKARGISQQQLGWRSGMAQARISVIEGGGPEHLISLRTLRRLADALGVEVEIRLVPRNDLRKLKQK